MINSIGNMSDQIILKTINEVVLINVCHIKVGLNRLLWIKKAFMLIFKMKKKEITLQNV